MYAVREDDEPQEETQEKQEQDENLARIEQTDDEDQPLHGEMRP
jgi:hypothetical protein